jgi:hypothetical protein
MSLNLGSIDLFKYGPYARELNEDEIRSVCMKLEVCAEMVADLHLAVVTQLQSDQ